MEEYFNEILKLINLKLNDKIQKLIESKHNGIREKLTKYISLEEDFLTGSYARNTLIKPKNEQDMFDVDVFIAFSNDDYGEEDLETLRVIIIKALKKIKENHTELGITNINEGQRRSIGLEFGSNFQIDIVPAIQIKKDALYKIFDKNTLEAIKSNPKLHSKNLTEANDNSESGSTKRLVPIVKLLKSWKREKCDYLKSFHLEMLAIKILGDEEIVSYSQGANKFFCNAEEYLQEACLQDPANKENIIDGYLDKDGNRKKVLALIKKEKEISKSAIELEEMGEDEKAKKEWGKIFALNEKQKTSQAIKDGQFYKVGGKVEIKTNPKSTNGQRISTPKSWQK